MLACVCKHSTKDLTEQERLSDWMYIKRWGIFLYHMRTKEWNAHMIHAIAKLVISRQIRKGMVIWLWVQHDV
jgi:hypothetical protein